MSDKVSSASRNPNSQKYKALIVSDKESFTNSISALIDSTKTCTVSSCADKFEARDSARNENYDVIIINSPIDGGLGDDFAKSFMRITYSFIIVLTPAEIADKMRARVTGLGISVLNKPLSKNEFLTSLSTACLMSERSKGIFLENEKLKIKMQEIKLVERAKVLLVEYLKLNESQAHKYIEKQAMELRKSKEEIAQNIIKTYEA